MPLLDLNGPSASLGELAELHGSRFSFTCGPCRHGVSYSGAEILARYPATVLFKHFQRHVICRKCRMGVDGDFRTLEFSSTDYLHRLSKGGHHGGGWSGPF